jgi:hypothetical protein
LPLVAVNVMVTVDPLQTADVETAVTAMVWATTVSVDINAISVRAATIKRVLKLWKSRVTKVVIL